MTVNDFESNKPTKAVFCRKNENNFGILPPNGTIVVIVSERIERLANLEYLMCSWIENGEEETWPISLSALDMVTSALDVAVDNATRSHISNDVKANIVTHLEDEDIFNMLAPKFRKNGVYNTHIKNLFDKASVVKMVALAYRCGYGRGAKNKPFDYPWAKRVNTDVNSITASVSTSPVFVPPIKNEPKTSLIGKQVVRIGGADSTVDLYGPIGTTGTIVEANNSIKVVWDYGECFGSFPDRKDIMIIYPYGTEINKDDKVMIMTNDDMMHGLKGKIGTVSYVSKHGMVVRVDTGTHFASMGIWKDSKYVRKVEPIV